MSHESEELKRIATDHRMTERKLLKAVYEDGYRAGQLAKLHPERSFGYGFDAVWDAITYDED